MNIAYENRYIQKSLAIQGSVGVPCGLEIRTVKFRIVRINRRVETLKDVSSLAAVHVGSWE